MDPYAGPDESNPTALRRPLARELDIPESALAKTRIARPARFITTAREATSEPLRPRGAQYLVGKYLGVVLTVEGRAFEIAEYEDLGGGMVPITPVRRPSGAFTLDEGAGLLEVLSPECRAVMVDVVIRRLSNKRRHRYTRCKFCQEMTPPEGSTYWEAHVCDACAATELGVDF